jgi:hypothetical protein
LVTSTTGSTFSVLLFGSKDTLYSFLVLLDAGAGAAGAVDDDGDDGCADVDDDGDDGCADEELIL